jgi:anti-anti-sigma factor
MQSTHAWSQPPAGTLVESPAPGGLRLSAEDDGRVACILCRGVLESRTGARLRRAVATALTRPRVLLCLDLEDVTLIDSYGVRVVGGVIDECAARGVHLELWPGPAVERALRTAGVETPRRAYPANPSRLLGDADRP